jgi:dolichol-phosphate mannosyltransferase
VVDDGSTDGTLACLTAALHPPARSLHILSHAIRSGQSAALRSGILAARGEWIVTLDGDGQNDPADIPGLLALTKTATPPTLICGQRQRRQDSWPRRFSSRVANTVRSRLLDDGVMDTGCGLKVFRRDDFLRLPWFDHMHRFLPALFRREGGTVVTREVHHRPRRRGQSKYGVHNRFWVGIVDLCGVLWLKRRGRIVQVRTIPERRTP